MAQPPSFRFYVEDACSRRSLEYVVTTARKTGDVYVSPGRGGNTKVSIHQTGDVNWSIIYDQLPTSPYVPDAGRHLAQWQSLSPGMQLPFFVWIASEDLRPGEPTPSPKAHRMAAPPPGFATQVDFLLTPPLEGTFHDVQPIPLWSVQLPNRRVLVLRHQDHPLRADQATQMLVARDVTWHRRPPSPNPYVLSRVMVPGGLSGMVELTPGPAPEPVHDPGFAWVPGRPGRTREAT